jgi:glycosyltransferase involved in cell wall biosynthesis
MSWQSSYEKKLRIGVFAWESLYSIKVGGIAPHVSELSEALAAKGHEVHIFTRSGGPDDYEQINGVHYHMVTHDQSGSIVYQMDRMCDAMYSRFFDVSV